MDDPRVSQFRLTAHLGLAFLIYGLMFWVALDLLRPRDAYPNPRLAGLRRFSTWLVGLVFVMVLTGGFVAGIRAGFAYNTFPLMNGHVVPPELFMLEPWWLNFFSNMATVQFDHRLLAWVLAFLVPWFWLRSLPRAVVRSRTARVPCAAGRARPPGRHGHRDAAAGGADRARGGASGGRRGAVLGRALGGARAASRLTQ